MSQGEASAPIEDDEYLYRRIPRSTGWFRDGVVSPVAFRPTRNDTTGLSLEREHFCKPEEVAAHGTNPSGYYVARVRAGKIRSLELEVVPTPLVHLGHAELPGLRFDNRRTDHAQEWQVKLAEFATREEVLGPYPGSQPNAAQAGT
jgi:hypothetical protein